MLKMFLYVIAMLLSGIAVMMGIIFYVQAKGDVPTRGMGLMLAIAGATICFQSLRTLIRLNREYQTGELQKVLDNPEQVLIEWQDEKDQRIIITAHALFIDEHHIPFEAFYSNLSSLKWEPPSLTFYLIQGAAARYVHKDIELTVPPDKFDELEPVVKALQAAYQSARKEI